VQMDQPPKLIVYGDFNCPFSALASARVEYLERHGFAAVDWRAVEHAPDIPSQGLDLIGDQRDELRGELDQIRSLLTDGEADQLTLPAIQSKTTVEQRWPTQRRLRSIGLVCGNISSAPTGRAAQTSATRKH